MFLDIITIKIKAGDGGNGARSFRRERYVDKGGPDGGDGGNGGSVIFVGDHNQNNLAPFRQKRHIEAESGQAGSKRKMHGRSGEDQLIEVPLGTVIRHGDEIIADITTDGQQVVAARGGKGGFGNSHFKSSTRQAPQIAEKGEDGQAREVMLELKMIADVGIIGLPNAGKSTFLSVVSNAKPEIASYPFTTLTPNLGVVDIDEDVLLLADIPGLIEGAAEGRGLGDEFLRHVERTKVLLHLIDATSDNVMADYHVIRKELKEYEIDLSTKSEVVALSKIELIDEEEAVQKQKELQTVVSEVFMLSSQTHSGVQDILYELKGKVAENSIVAEEEAEVLPQTNDFVYIPDKSEWTVEKIDQGFKINGESIEKFARKTDFSDYHLRERFMDILRKRGVYKELTKLGVAEGDIVYVADTHFNWDE